ncbi:MAG: phosphatidate cytidylyltransferase [Nitrospirae bacterium]|nr:phosphatidate cytidylyltransferase [Nitrospirota bacterium]MBI3595039.1 phosphatidate cytidylyltransferase [Nitrospirota bacterium]
MKRLGVALLFFPLFYFLVAFQNPIYFFFFVVLVSSLGLYEFYALYFKEKRYSVLIAGELLSLIMLGGFYLQGIDLKGLEKLSNPFFLSLIVSALFLIFLTVHLKMDRRSYFLSVSVMGMGMIYVTWFLGHLILIRLLEKGPEWIFLLAMVTWGTDSGALFTGKLFGRRKLAPAISPNKTIEGAIGGILFGVGMALLARAWFVPFFSLKEIVILAILMSVAGQTGDLVESMFKRDNQVKDSSNLLPGHGGILDKIDSFIFTTPLLFYYLIYFLPL